MGDALGDVQVVVHLPQIGDEQSHLLVVAAATQLHLVGNDGIPGLGGLVLGVEGDDLGQVHGVGSAVDDVGAVVCKGGTGLVGHGVDNAKQCVGEGHAGQTLGVVHSVPLLHVSVVAAYQVMLNHADGVDGQGVGVVAVGGGHIGLDGVGHGVHAGVSYQLLGHGLCQGGVYDGHIRGDFKVCQGVLDALLIVGNDGEGGDLRGGAGGGGDGAEPGLPPQLGNAEDLAHLRESDLRVLVLDPHGLGCIDGRAAADGYNPVRLELLHSLSAPHNGVHRRIGLDPLEYLHLHAGLFQVGDDLVQEAELLHGAAAYTDHGFLAVKGLQGIQSALSMINVSGKCKSCHNSFPPNSQCGFSKAKD